MLSFALPEIITDSSSEERYLLYGVRGCLNRDEGISPSREVHLLKGVEHRSLSPFGFENPLMNTLSNAMVSVSEPFLSLFTLLSFTGAMSVVRDDSN